MKIPNLKDSLCQGWGDLWMLLLRSEIPSGMCAKLRTVVPSNNRDHPTRSLYHCLFAAHTYIFVLRAHPVRITQSQHQRRGCNKIPSFLQRTTPIARSLCKGWTQHDLHILVTAPFCCDRKSRAACAQSFAPWQQAAVEIMLAISLTIACSRYVYNGVILHVRGESHNQRNTTGEVATLPFRAKRIRCLVPLAHNGSGVFGAKRLSLASMSFVKVFRSKWLALFAKVRVC